MFNGTLCSKAVMPWDGWRMLDSNRFFKGIHKFPSDSQCISSSVFNGLRFILNGIQSIFQGCRRIFFAFQCISQGFQRMSKELLWCSNDIFWSPLDFKRLPRDSKGWCLISNGFKIMFIWLSLILDNSSGVLLISFKYQWFSFEFSVDFKGSQYIPKDLQRT